MGCAVVEAGTREANDVFGFGTLRHEAVNVFSSAQLDVLLAPSRQDSGFSSVFALPPQSLNPAAVVRVVTADTAVFNPNPASLTEGLLLSTPHQLTLARPALHTIHAQLNRHAARSLAGRLAGAYYIGPPSGLGSF